MSKNKSLVIRSSAAEFLIFESQKHEKGIEVRFEDGDLWLTQKSIADLFNTSKQDISYHLGKVFLELELDENSVVKKYLTTADDGKNYNTNYYNIDAVISVGYRVNSDRTIQFRRWATNIPMTMEDWATRIDKYLLSDDRDVLKDTGKISHEIACDKALTEFEKYRIKQDKLYKSDFDKMLEETGKLKEQNDG